MNKRKMLCIGQGFVICDFKTRTFFIKRRRRGGVSHPDFTPYAYAARKYAERGVALLYAQGISAERPDRDCGVISAEAAWAMERIRERDA